MSKCIISKLFKYNLWLDLHYGGGFLYSILLIQYEFEFLHSTCLQQTFLTKSEHIINVSCNPKQLKTFNWLSGQLTNQFRFGYSKSNMLLAFIINTKL